MRQNGPNRVGANAVNKVKTADGEPVSTRVRTTGSGQTARPYNTERFERPSAGRTSPTKRKQGSKKTLYGVIAVVLIVIVILVCLVFMQGGFPNADGQNEQPQGEVPPSSLAETHRGSSE